MNRNPLVNFAALAFAAVITVAALGTTAALAGQEYTQASMAVLDDMPVLALQTVVVVAKRV